MSRDREPAETVTAFPVDGTILEQAQCVVAHGVSVTPIKADGSEETAVADWKPYRIKRPTDAELTDWFGGESLNEMAVVCGPASSNLMVLEFGSRDGKSAYEEWAAQLSPEAAGHLTTCPSSSPRTESGSFGFASSGRGTASGARIISTPRSRSRFAATEVTRW